MSLISITRKEGLECEIRVRGHRVVSDMSESDGGLDRGLSPAEMMVSSLGVCMVMMVQIYCDRHGYSDGEVSASVTYGLADKPKRVGTITIDLEIPKDVPDDKRQVVRRVAEACVIQGTFTEPPIVDMEII
jgi:putative redox protein